MRRAVEYSGAIPSRGTQRVLQQTRAGPFGCGPGDELERMSGCQRVQFKDVPVPRVDALKRTANLRMRKAAAQKHSGRDTLGSDGTRSAPAVPAPFPFRAMAGMN